MKSAHDCFTNPLINPPKNNRARDMSERERPDTPVLQDLASVVGSFVSQKSQDQEHADKQEAGPKITFVVVDDHPVIREGLVDILNSQKDISVVGQAAD